ncbi:MAG TPA: AAA family ATPase, partial [Thermoplasmatales archaeon]|nr:AAA family ATPase [Thermoplasmatales archaeon]
MAEKRQTDLKGSEEHMFQRRRRVKEFKETLETCDIDEVDKRSLEFIVEYFDGKHNPKLSSRLFLFHGPPGVGKTFLAEKLLKALDVEVVYLACNSFSFDHAVRCSTLDEVVKKADNNKKQVLFLDDLMHMAEKKEDELSDEAHRKLMQLIEFVKNNPGKIMIITVNSFYTMGWNMLDRIEVKIDFDLPSDANKLRFLNREYKEYLSSGQRRFIAVNSIGYNYRELTEMIKLSYRLAEGRITMQSVKKALKIYQSLGLGGYDILNGVETNVGDLIGKERAKKVIERLVKIYRNSDLGEKLGLRGANLLLFYGPPGTGKSFTAKALAGELGFPLVNITGEDLMQDPVYVIDHVVELAKRYRNCVIFIDEADKFIGNDILEEDNPVLGELHSSVDGVDDREIQSILILAVNNLSRFSETLLDRFTLVKFDLPSYEERMVFFRKKVREAKQHVRMSVSYRELAKSTSNMSFRDIERFWNELMFHHLDNKTR